MVNKLYLCILFLFIIYLSFLISFYFYFATLFLYKHFPGGTYVKTYQNKIRRTGLSYCHQRCRSTAFIIFAYCLMSNHVHLLMRHPETLALETVFRRINTAYAIWFNMKYNRTGFSGLEQMPWVVSKHSKIFIPILHVLNV